MFTILAFIKRKEGMSREAFRAYYETKHSPLINSIAPSAQSYQRSFICFGDTTNVNEEHIDFDVVTEMSFLDRAHFDRWLAAVNDPFVRKSLEDDQNSFMDLPSFRVCAVHVST